MKVSWKVMTLATFANVIGVLWIVAAMAAVYFLYGALNGDGPWSFVSWAAVCAIVLRQLASVLNGAKKRVDYVEQLISRGYSRKNAFAAWRTAHSGGTNLLRNLQQSENAEGNGRQDVAMKSELENKLDN